MNPRYWLPLLLLASGNSVRAQEATKTSSDAVVTIRQADEKRFPDITLEFEVKSASGEPILDATRDEFRVFEYDKPVTITQFQSPVLREFRPTTVVLVLDRSSSMRKDDRIGALKDAVSAFLEKQPKGSRVAVLAFGSDVQLICPFTDNPETVRAAVGEMFANGQTRYYDAVQAALQLLAEETGRRAILAMTDGQDTFSQVANLDAVVKLAQKEGLPVHTLALGDEDEIEANQVRALAERTRGQSFSARNPEALQGIFEEIARNLGQTYSLSYQTDRKLQDGTLRPIKILFGKSSKAAETSVFIPGMVVPAAGWSALFLVLITALVGASALPRAGRKSVL